MDKWKRILYQPNLPLGKDGKRVTGSPEHILLSKSAALEGMILLKNENSLLPFAKGTRLALFGKGTFDYVKGGGGSGDVTVAYTVNLFDGLNALKDNVSIEEATANYYRDYVAEQYRKGSVPGMISEPELPDALCAKARSFTDTAVITISRFSGEGWDRNIAGADMGLGNEKWFATKGSELFEKGDFYLSNAEAAMVEKVKAYFDKIIVVLNVGGMVDTEWFFADSKIGAVLLALQGGMEGGTAMAEMLCGLANPSGKLSDTFAKRLEDYPSTAGFHESINYVNYTEDIYVGYRYFETLPGAAEKVNYPFGYGLSYTKFDWHILSAEEKEGKIRVCLTVTNIGRMAGKEVFQAYVSAPQGLLGKAARSLVAFRKTRLLAPGEQQLIVLEFDTASMASYDDLGKIAKSAYVLEKGEYRFYVGTSVRDTVELDYKYCLDSDTIVEQLTSKLAPSALPCRLRSDGTYEELPMKETPAEPAPPFPVVKDDAVTPGVRAVPRIQLRHFWNPDLLDFRSVAEGKLSLDDFMAKLSIEDLAHLLGGQPNTGVANTFGMGNMPDYRIPNAMTADGPAGLRIARECGVTTTAFPCATLLACTWNEDVTFAVGEAGAKEVKENNIAAWLTPAVNIHRSPLCGRNFEYYSEDPFLAGRMAASLVKGIQSQHISPSVKHFAVNNKETNRKSSDSRVSERAAREIYLKVFEIIVKTAKPWYIMSSYNLVNGTQASENRDLLTGILRDEWGFDGIVSTDWWTRGAHYKEVKAGNDLKMAAGYPEQLVAAYEAGLLSREEMEICVRRILSLLLKFD